MQAIITPTAPEWDAFVMSHPRAHALQLSAWGELKSAYGWRDERIALTENGRIVGGAQVLYKPLPFKLGALAYVPFGGYVSHNSQWGALWGAIKQASKKRHVALLKWEAGFYMKDARPPLAEWGFLPSPQTVQPPRTVLIDIASDDEAILARMNQGTRRKVRQSLKNDIQYTHATPDDVKKFTGMMTHTGERNDFGVHEASYYEMAYRLFVPQHASLILAEHEGDVLAGVFVFAVGNTAWYVYGASSSTKRNLMASYGVQWHAIQWAKARGCTTYDLWGIPDEDESTLEAQFETRNDGLWGVYGFKRGWGGTVARSLGAWDLPYNQLLYALYRWRLKGVTE